MEEKSWISLIAGIFVEAAQNIRHSVERSLQEKIAIFIKKIIAAFLFIVGLVFFLNGAAIFIGNFAGNIWAGYAIVGVVVGAVGIILLNKN